MKIGLKTLSVVIIISCITIFPPISSVYAASLGYGINISYDSSAKTNIGTFNSENLKAVFNTNPSGAGKPSTARPTDYLSAANTWVGTGNVAGYITHSYSDSTTGKVSYSITADASRTDDGTYGLKVDYTEAKNSAGVSFATLNKTADGTRDLYFSVWIKPLKADGTLGSYSTYEVSQSTPTERFYAPFGVLLMYTNASGSTSQYAFLSESNAVEETTEDGWRKISAVIPAQYAKAIKFSIFAINFNEANNYGIDDRAYLLIDDVYLTEIPTSIEFDETAAYTFSPYKPLDLSSLTVYGSDAIGEKSRIDSDLLIWSAENPEGYINTNNELVYEGNPYVSGVFSLKAEMMGKAATQEIIFRREVFADSILDNGDGTYSVSITNTSSEDASGCLVVTVYEGKILRSIVYTQADSIKSGETQTITTEAISVDSIENPTVRTFVRNSLFGFEVLD